MGCCGGCLRGCCCSVTSPAANVSAMDATGYMIECSWDGAALRVHPKNKGAAVGLMGEHHDGDLIVPRDAIADVAWKGASALVNGKITVTTTAGSKHQLHFRKKQQEGMEALAEALQT